jgi:hypothetical protein
MRQIASTESGLLVPVIRDQVSDIVAKARIAAKGIRLCGILDSGQVKMAAMSIYKVLRRTEPFGVSFRVCESNDAGVESCDQFLTQLSLRDCSVYTQRALRAGPRAFLQLAERLGRRS